MYRILSASKDAYCTSKYMAGSQSLDANTGQAATLDFYKLYDNTYISSSVTGTIERSRGFIQFDYSELTALTSSILNIANSSFKCYVSMKDIYCGQTTPSNFSLRLIPLSRSWDEGRGYDVVSYRDVDAVNEITASIAAGAPSLWFMSGAGASGTLGASSLDIITSGNIGSGLQDLTVTQTFTRGDEDLSMDVSSLVSASIAGMITNNGFRISFIEHEEYDSITRFVKRFGARHCNNKDYRPKLIVKYSDTIKDYSGRPQFNNSQDLFVYNVVDGIYTNFTSGSTGISGSNCLLLKLIASRSVTFTTSSWSLPHSATINHITRSLAVLTQSYTSSQYLIGAIAQTGIYSASVNLSTVTNSALINFLTGSEEQEFEAKWMSLDGTYTYAKNYLTFKKPLGQFSNTLEKNYVVNVTNLKQVYVHSEVSRLRVFVQDYNTEAKVSRYATDTTSVILYNMKWRLRRAYTREIVVPFDNTATLLSTDSNGMFFDLYLQDLDVNEIYELEFMITEGGRDHYITNDGWKFKVLDTE